MNKREIVDILGSYSFDKDRIEIVSESAMVIFNIKETSKMIFICADESYERELLEKYDVKKDFETFMIGGIINFSFGEIKKEISKYGYYIQSPEDMLNNSLSEADILRVKDFINIKNTNSLVLAYLGDAVFELYIREYLIKYNLKVKELQNRAISYVSARSQSGFLDNMIDDRFLNNDEIEIVKRARNHKSHPSKNSDIVTYKKSTGLEALIGYLRLTKDNDRIEEIMRYIVGD